MTSKWSVLTILLLLVVCDFMAADKCDPKNVDAIFERLDKCDDCKSLLKTYLTPDVFKQLKDKTTKGGANLCDCILSGVLNKDNPVGVYAADQESYSVFAPLFDPVIMDLFNLKHPDDISQPNKDLGTATGLVDIDPGEKYVLSTHIEVVRSHVGFAFPPVLTLKDRVDLEKMTVPALEGMTDEDLKGTYYIFTQMKDNMRQDLMDEWVSADPYHKLIDDDILRKDWPHGRGIFHNNAKTFYVLVNFAEHLRIGASEKGGDFFSVYRRLLKGLNYLEKQFEFARNKRLGFLSFLPSNIGTGLRVTVRMRLPFLSSKPPDEFDDALRASKLQAKAVPKNPGVFDISNTQMFGVTEISIVQNVAKETLNLINTEIENE